MFLLYFDGEGPIEQKEKCTACSFGTSLFQSKMPKSDGPQTSQTYLIFGWQAKNNNRKHLPDFHTSQCGNHWDTNTAEQWNGSQFLV